MRSAAHVHGAMRLAATLICVALVCRALSAHSAGASSKDADKAPTSPLVALARRGEVAAPTIEETERMCALLTSCDDLPIPPALFPADFPSCVRKMSDEMSSPASINYSLTMRECGLKASSCPSLRACAMRGASSDACSGRGRQAVVGLCDVEGRAVTCWHDKVLAVRDCARGGEQCVVTGGEATCTLGSCPADMREGDKARCSASGRHLLHCERGKLASLDCAAFGLKCIAADGAVAGCATGGPPCSTDATRCEGGVAVGCFNGHEVRVDCRAGGLDCAPSPGAAAMGVCFAPRPSTGPCDPADRATCEGDSIHYCYRGTARSVSCQPLGFRKCDARKGSVRCGD